MIVLRQLVPVVGYSINVTSIVITTFLAALALGYRAGGRIRIGHASLIARNLIGAGLLMGVGLSFVMVDFLFDLYFAAFNQSLLAVALYSLIVVAPVIYLLAQTVVLLINFREASAAAEQAGDTFHVSTIGNVIGGLVTTLVVMYYLGIAAAIFLDVVLLVWAYVLVARHRPVVIALTSIGVVLTAFVLNVIAERALFIQTTAYADYYITDEQSGEGRLLVVNGQSASRTSKHGIGHGYIEWFEDQLFAESTDAASVLVLGAGGFTLGQGRNHASNITFVDVDEHLAGIADQFLGKGVREGQFIAKDARAHLLRTSYSYDAIIVDTYSHRSSMPPHLMTQEFFSLVRERLLPTGTAYINILASDDEGHQFTRGIDNTIRSVFASCSIHKITTQEMNLYNKLYRCQRSRLDGFRNVYTDKNTRADRNVVR